MERYRISWIPSPSTFVEKRQLLGKIGGGPETLLVDNLPSSAFTTIIDLVTDSAYEVYTRVFGDNSTTADSVHVIFTAQNKEQVLPDTGLTIEWMGHIV